MGPVDLPTLAALAIRHPVETLDRLRGKIEGLRTHRKPGRLTDRLTDEWEAKLHGALGVSWPCDEVGRFRTMWSDLEASLEFAGRAYDADPALSLAAWCFVTHRSVERCVETGVARGITSRVVLEALSRVGGGHLWSLDFPPVRKGWSKQVGVAVPASLRSGWTYVRGSTRRRLPRLLDRVGSIDLFIQDSAHTEPTVRFELEVARRHLAPGGAVIVDDIELNEAFFRFVVESSPRFWFSAPQDAKRGAFGMAIY